MTAHYKHIWSSGGKKSNTWAFVVFKKFQDNCDMHLDFKKWLQVFLLFGDFPGGSDSKSVCLQCRRPRYDPCVRKIPWRRKWQPTPVLLPGKSHRQRSLVGYSSWGRKESDRTEWLRFHFGDIEFYYFSVDQSWYSGIK